MHGDEVDTTNSESDLHDKSLINKKKYIEALHLMKEASNDSSTSYLIEGEEYVNLKYSRSDALLIAQKRTVHMHVDRRTTVYTSESQSELIHSL